MIVKPGKGGQQPTTLAICVNQRYGADRPSCAGRGSIGLADRLAADIQSRRLNVTVERLVCFGFCQRGPNMRLYPGGSHYYEVSAADIPELLAEIEKVCGRRPDDDRLASLHLIGS